MGLSTTTGLRRHPGRDAAACMIVVAALATASSGAASAGPTRAGAGTAVRPHAAAAAPHPAVAGRWWIPSLGSQSWQWELSNPLALGNAKMMGTNNKLPDGRSAPAPVIYDIDGIINSASTVSALHTLGKTRRLLRRSRSDRELPLGGRRTRRRFLPWSIGGCRCGRRRCARLARAVHRYPLADMQPLADAVLTERCNQYSSCDLLITYFGTKSIFDAEYELRPRSFCAKDTTLGINGAQFHLNLTGVRKPRA